MTHSAADHASDDIAIRRLESEYDDAWNAGDIRRLTSLYRPDAVVVNPLGERAQGHRAISAALETFLTGPGRGSRHSSRVHAISYLQEAVAVVDGEARLEGLGAPFSERVATHAFTDILVKELRGRWAIAQTRAYVFASREASKG
jgi:uncharacterized protein (TIGR02246 family)